MSEAFDPEHVTRLYLNNAGPFGSDTGKVECVRAADYDKLLALYRELVPLPPDPSTLPTIAEMRGLLNR